MMYIRYFLYTIIFFIATIVGMFGGYFLARYLHVGENIWGNVVDGYDGDSNYQNKEAIAPIMPTKCGSIVGATASFLYSCVVFDVNVVSIAIVFLFIGVFNIWNIVSPKSCAAYNWSCVRNPCNNLLRHTLSAKGVILHIKRKGNLTIITMADHKKYFFWYNVGSAYEMKFGWKFWLNEIEPYKYYVGDYVINP